MSYPQYKKYKLVEIVPQQKEQSSNNIQQHQEFNVGSLYIISTKKIIKKFICVGYIDTIKEDPDINLDIVIMKQISGQMNNIWSLNEDDCEFLHINYEKNLQVYPATYEFKLIQ